MVSKACGEGTTKQLVYSSRAGVPMGEEGSIETGECVSECPVIRGVWRTVFLFGEVSENC